MNRAPVYVIAVAFFIGACGEALPAPVGCADPTNDGLLCLIEPNLSGVCEAGVCKPLPCASDGECYGDTDNCQMGICVAGACGSAPMPDGVPCHTPAHTQGACSGGSCVP